LLPFVLPFVAVLDSTVFIRVNQVGYLADAPKVAVVCALDASRVTTFSVLDPAGRVVLGPRRARASGAFGPCTATFQLDFSQLRAPGTYEIRVLLAVRGATPTASVRIARAVYAGGADTLLYYMREQRSGWNPLFKDSVHTHDGNVIDDSGRVVKFQPVSGGWADASDYLQYVTTSATATYMMLAAYRDHARAFADAFDAKGLPGANGVPDVLDEARHGLEW